MAGHRNHSRDAAKRSPGTLGGTAERKPPRHVPLPAALDGRSYEVRDSGGTGRPAYVGRDDTTGVMVVPLGADEADRRTRLHEMAHVRWTPSGRPDTTAPHETLNAVEDCRIHKRLKEIGLDHAAKFPVWDADRKGEIVRTFEVHADADNRAKPWPPIEVARMLVAAIGTAEESFFRSVSGDYGHGWIHPIVDAMHAKHFGSRRPAWKRTIAFAEDLEEAFAGMDETITSDVQNRLMEYQENGDTSAARWGDMHVREMDLSVRLPRGMRTRVRRSSDSGAVPRNWHRLAVDQRVFSVRRYRPGGGTVLIDQSGSMHLDPDEVQAIIAAFPAVTIATYAGRGGRGELRIIARNGARATDEDCLHPMNGNIIDGPALEWLNDQTGPRVWVSDGMVTGADESMNPSLVIDAAKLCRAGHVQRVDRLAAIVPNE